MSRLPSQVDARNIMVAGGLNTASDAQKKAKNNLLKSINWAFGSLSDQQKLLVRQKYTATKPLNGDTLDNVLAKANRGTVSADEVAAVVEAILSTNSALKFSLDRYVQIDPAQAQVFGTVLVKFKTHLDEINSGTHNDLLDRVFPDPWGWVPFAEYQKKTRERVKAGFQAAYDVVKGWYDSPHDRLARIRIDTTLDSQKAGGLSKQTGLELPASFFDAQSPNYTLEKRTSTIVHESTHSIQNNNYVTNDDGGYIGTGKFQKATLEESLKNASHFQYVFERIMNMPENQPQDIAKDANVIQAKMVIQNAWIYAINCYTTMQRYTASTQRPTDPDQENIRNIGKLFGLSVGKDVVGVPEVTISDLSGIENRVGKLGVLLGAVERAAGLVPQDHRTTDEILKKLVEAGGAFQQGMAIRKATSTDKTIAMIKVAAMHCHNTINSKKTTEDQRNKALDDFSAKRFGAIPDVHY